MTPALMPPRRDPTRHRVHPHRRVTSSDQVAEEARYRRQPSSDRPCRQARLAITDADHGTVSTLMREELEHVGSHHVERRLFHDREECLQVMSDGAQRVRPTPPTDELQVAVDDGITQDVTGHARERSGPDDNRKRTYPVRLPATLRQPTDAPKITRVSGVLGQLQIGR